MHFFWNSDKVELENEELESEREDAIVQNLEKATITGESEQGNINH
jgi:hypothetical protein